MVEICARRLAALHYADRFKKPIDDPHVTMNVDGNWNIFASDVRATLETAYASGGLRLTVDRWPQALVDVSYERDRQVHREGWTPEHDDQHTGFELARAAARYAQHAGYKDKVRRDIEKRGPTALHAAHEAAWFRPKDRRRDLVRAGALILAEIERLDRAELRKAEASREAAGDE
ncbi:MAG: hypothetical protein HOQ20_10885 [Bradyrhizobium sp.]|nr:hypothetical protein [Bradyrhizobium sp.]